MRIPVCIAFIIITSLFAKVENFEGYVNTNHYRPIYAIGNYKNNLMVGFWEFYTDSTKKVKIAKGSFLDGNGSKISNTGIPKNGRNGEWKHYYRYSQNRGYQRTLSNTIKAIQNWENGKMDGEVITYFPDGKKSASSYYKDGKRDGIRKEWFAGGFQGSKIARRSTFNFGKLVNDKLITYGNRKLLTTNFINGNRVDSIFQSVKGFNSNVFIVKSYNRMKMFHNNGNLYTDFSVNEDGSGKIKNFYDNGQLMIELNFDSLNTVLWHDNIRICYDIDGKIIDKIKFKEGIPHGNVIELMTSDTNINDNLEMLFTSYVHYNYNSQRDISFKGGEIFYTISSDNIAEWKKRVLITDTSQKFTSYSSRYGDSRGQNIKKYILKTTFSIGPFQPNHHYRYHYNQRDWYPINLYNSDNREGFDGVKTQTLDSEKLKGYNYCVGYGAYNDGIRVGKWFWKDKDRNKILEGNFNDEGNPVGQWDSYGIDEVFTFSNDGELIKRIKTIID